MNAVNVLSAQTATVVSGFGYTGSRLSAELRKRDCPVTVIVRSTQCDDQIKAIGCRPLLWDLDDETTSTVNALDNAVLFHLIPPPSEGTVDSRLRQLLDQLSGAAPSAIILASTSGVYGDRQGEWVREDDQTAAATERARRRIDAETVAQEFCKTHGTRLVILRIAGIYGPGRLPLARLRSGLPLPPSHEIGFSNRIHVDDLVTVLLAAAQNGIDGEIVNVADGQPSSTRDWFETVARLADLSPPPLVSLAEAEATGKISPMFLSFLRESRRLDVSRMKNLLQTELAYANPEDGICAALAEEARLLKY